jgi:galactose mutarotase-like enzyme
MPFSIGGHPSFALQNEFENYSLQFETSEILNCYLLQNDLLSKQYNSMRLKKNILPLSYSLFDNDALIIKKMQSKQIKILENKIPFLNFKFNDFPNFGIWTKKNAPFVCLEPWFGYSDLLESNGDILKKEGVLSFIIPTNWMTINNNLDLRKFVLNKDNIEIYFINGLTLLSKN